MPYLRHPFRPVTRISFDIAFPHLQFYVSLPIPEIELLSVSSSPLKCSHKYIGCFPLFAIGACLNRLSAKARFSCPNLSYTPNPAARRTYPDRNCQAGPTSKSEPGLYPMPNNRFKLQARNNEKRAAEGLNFYCP